MPNVDAAATFSVEGFFSATPSLSLITLADIQQWLNGDQYENLTLDEQLVQSAKTRLFGKLRTRFHTERWTTYASTPEAVRVAISMLVASIIYRRDYSETNPSENNYATWLEMEAHRTVDELIDGVTVLA